MNKKVISLLFVALFLILLCGCGGANKKIYNSAYRAYEAENWETAIQYFEQIEDKYEVKEELDICRYNYVRCSDINVREAYDILKKCDLSNSEIKTLFDTCKDLNNCVGTYNFYSSDAKDYSENKLVVEIFLVDSMPYARVYEKMPSLRCYFDSAKLKKSSGDYLFECNLINGQTISPLKLSKNKAVMRDETYISKPTITYMK